jgi:RNA polymerase sigma factor (sigma-70 family)
MDWEQIYCRLAADANDARAWSALERRVRAWARAVFWKHGHHLVEDVVADTCASVAVNLEGARGAETFAGFAYGHFLNARRAVLRSGLPTGQPLGSIDIAAPLANDDGLDPDVLGRLRLALAAIPQRERTAVVMRYFHESNSARIAAELGVTTGNARRILFNGLSRLRAQLGSRAEWLTEGSARMPSAATLR